MSSNIHCHTLYQQQRAEFLSSYQPQTMAYDTVRHVNDSYAFRVAPDIDLSVVRLLRGYVSPFGPDLSIETCVEISIL